MPPKSESSFIGMELSGSNLRAATVDNEGVIGERREAALQTDGLVGQVAQLVGELRQGANKIEAVGLALPGLINRLTDRVIASRDLPATVRENLHAEFMEATGLRFELENDANAAAYGEFKIGAGRGSRNLFYITIGEGIGGAIILDGKLWTGASGLAGEVGHITIDTEGAECYVRQYRLPGNGGVGAKHRAARERAAESRHFLAFQVGDEQRFHRRRYGPRGERGRRFFPHDD